MRFRLALLSAALPALLISLESATLAQVAPLAPQGIGLLPSPAEAPTSLAGAPPAHPFVRSPSGEFSRVIFETDDGPDFKIIVRDYFFPPRGQLYSVLLTKGGLLHLLSGEGNVAIADQRLPTRTSTRTVAPLGASLTVSNHGEAPVIVRVLTLEPK